MNIASKHSPAAASLLLGCQMLAGCAAPAAPPAMASPQPGASPLPTAAAPTVASNSANLSATVAAPEPSPFHIVATGMNLQLITSSDDVILFDGSQLLASVEGDRIVNHPEYLGSYRPEEFESFNSLGGKWPDAAWFTVSRPAQRTGYSVLYEKVGKGWRLRAQTKVSENYQAIQEWDKGRRIALVTGMFPYYEWEILHGTSQNAPKPQISSNEDADLPGFYPTAELPVDFAALSTGHLFAVGPLFNEDRSWVVERWEPNHAKSQLDNLPNPADPTLMPAVIGMAAFAPNDVYVFGQLDQTRAGSEQLTQNVGAYLVHFDGVHWTPSPFASNAGISSMSASDGVIWATSGGSLWKKSDPQAPWVGVALPSDPALIERSLRDAPKGLKGTLRLVATRVMARSGHDVWVESIASDTDPGHDPWAGPGVILRNRAHPEVWQSLQDEKQARAIEQFQPLRAANESCQSIFVLLYGMTRTTPKDYDYPLTRAALKGHPEFATVTFAETVDRGEHYFGAFIPEFALGKKLLAVVRKNVKDSKPVMLCRHPKKVRLLEFDLKTGAVTKNVKVDE